MAGGCSVADKIFASPAVRAQFEINVAGAGKVLDAAVELHRGRAAERGELSALVSSYTACGLIDRAAAATMLTVAISRLAAQADAVPPG